MVVNAHLSIAAEQNAMGSYTDKEKAKVQLEYRSAEKKDCMQQVLETRAIFRAMLFSNKGSMGCVCVYVRA